MRILYVEDDQATACALQLILTKNGHKVELARTAAQAKAMCSDKNFDLWILDIGLPDGHGGDLLHTLRRMSDTKAIALTGHGSPHEVDEGMDDGFDAYLTKPASVGCILKTLDQLLGK
jgi:DNA-binding response OmpR family regulator